MATDQELAELETPKLKKGPLTKLIGFREELKSGANVSVFSIISMVHVHFLLYHVLHIQHYMKDL